MKKILLIVCLFSFISLAQNTIQESDSLIQLYPGMEDTISYVDRTYFGLYNQISGFKNAVVYVRNDEELVSRINYEENGVLKDTILINDLSVLESTREKIDALIQEYNEKLTESYNVVVKTFYGGKYSGKLESFSKDYIYIITDKNLYTGTSGKFNYKIPVSYVDEVVIKGKSDYLTPVLWGTGIGAVSGFLAPIAFSDLFSRALEQDGGAKFDLGDSLLGALYFAIVGAAAGFVYAVIDDFLISQDETIRFKTTLSVLMLKDYAKYNIRSNKSFDESYEEINE